MAAGRAVSGVTALLRFLRTLAVRKSKRTNMTLNVTMLPVGKMRRSELIQNVDSSLSTSWKANLKVRKCFRQWNELDTEAASRNVDLIYF